MLIHSMTAAEWDRLCKDLEAPDWFDHLTGRIIRPPLALPDFVAPRFVVSSSVSMTRSHPAPARAAVVSPFFSAEQQAAANDTSVNGRHQLAFVAKGASSFRA